MVVIEEVPDAAPSQFQPPGRGEPCAFVVVGAGLDDANGVYLETGKQWHGAKVYENQQKCLLSREPHTNSRTGETSYGWILGQDKRALYAVKTDALAPPDTGWRKFAGAAPVPTFTGFANSGDAAQAAAQAFKEAGNDLFAAQRYAEAAEKYTRGLGLAGLRQDAFVKVALYSNRAECRLRLRRWEEALSDAQACLLVKPMHDKALLRGAVAAREMGRLQVAMDMAERCISAHPRLKEAQEMHEELQKQARSKNEELIGERAAAARRKLRGALRGEEAEADPLAEPRAFAAKDVNSKKGFKAFEGYSDKKVQFDEKPPLSALPYHHMGLPQDQVQLMDGFFKEMREKKAAKEKQDQADKSAYEALRREYREKAQEDVSSGKLATMEELFPSQKVRRQQEEEARRKHEEEKALAAAAAADAREARRRKADDASLPPAEAAAIDRLFQGLPTKEGAGAEAAGSELAAASSSSGRRQRLERAKQLASIGAPQAADWPGDRRTQRERELDREEAEERAAASQRSLAELQALRYSHGGEPTRFEQACREVYCWWTLPSDVKGSEVKVSASKGGTWLTVSVRDVVIFDRTLFATIRADDVVWCVQDSELHLTLTKAETNKLWEKLAEVPEVRRDDEGRVLPETVPEPLSANQRMETFRKMLSGDDGQQVGYEELDANGKRLVDAMRRYQHAQATGDAKALYEAEEDLEDFGRLVV